MGHVRRRVDPMVEAWFRMRLGWKMGILVERDLGGVGEKVDALEVLQDIVGQPESTKMLAVMSAAL